MASVGIPSLLDQAGRAHACAAIQPTAPATRVYRRAASESLLERGGLLARHASDGGLDPAARLLDGLHV
jgi:hypothetical protein